MADLPKRFGFYGIISDPVRGVDYLARLFVDREIPFIQLRMKKETRREIYKAAELLRKVTDGTPSRFIVNDHPDIARDVYADGVHVGQEDASVEEARAVLDRPAIVGLSTHSEEQVKKSIETKPDYIGVGPLFPTPTKEKADPAIGIAGMKRMIEIASVPAVAIGAIDAGNLREILRAGAVNFCSVRPVNATPNPEKHLKELLSIYREEIGI